MVLRDWSIKNKKGQNKLKTTSFALVLLAFYLSLKHGNDFERL
ncbi:hypothetical protein RU88_GL000120 [Lactococcus raffinolactis]|nr:hypothetical protein RU88_GL000120 [Lactococcus raffinolactis]